MVHLHPAPLPQGEDRYDNVAYRFSLASQWEELPFTKDFLYRLVEARNVAVKQLTDGTRDQWGRSHDEEKRAMIHVIDTLLSYIPKIKMEMALLEKGRAMIENRGKAPNAPIHGDDPLLNV